VNWHSTAYGLFSATSICTHLERDEIAMLACCGRRNGD
jgi:hypothetical protein